MLGLLVGNALGAPIVENEVAVEAHAPNLNQQGRELFALYNLGSKVSKLKSRAASKEITSVQLMMSALGDQNAAKTPIKAVEMLALNDDLNTVVKSDNMCTRRAAMARAAGLAAGLALSQVSAPGFAAETKMVKMGSDTGNLVFIPDEIKICKGDSVTWTNNKGGPHNVVFDEDAIPSGVDKDKISMDDQLGDEGATYTTKLDVPGTYGYYCEPHAGAGMKATVIVA